MAIHWTQTARARLLPYPGEPWTIALDLRGSARALEKQVGVVPDQPTLEAEVERGLAARLDHRYDEKGNHPRDVLGRHLVDLWVARRDVVFATEVAIAIARSRPTTFVSSTDKPYDIRRDGQPWGRLREHLLTAPTDLFVQARAVAASARTEPTGELLPALAYAFCEREWVDEDLDVALQQGYGQLALLACLTEPARIAGALERVVETLYQLIEEAVPHIPNVMSRLGDDGSGLIVTTAGLAWDKTSRKPWLDLVRCYDTREAHIFLAKHGK